MKKMICDMCRRKYDYDYEVSDQDWSGVTGIEDGSGKMCLSCFDNLAYMKEYRYNILLLVFPEWWRWKERK